MGLKDDLIEAKAQSALAAGANSIISFTLRLILFVRLRIFILFAIKLKFFSVLSDAYIEVSLS